MKLGILLALAFAAITTPLHAQSVRERFGNIEYAGKDGITRTLTTDGGYGDPVLSPDGRTVAFIHIDGGTPQNEMSDKPTSLWVADGLTGKARRLFAPHYGDAPQTNMESFGHPIFSLDGGFIYVSASGAWATSYAVHQISVATGKEKFVIDGSVGSLLRTGRYRGFLLVGRHKYWPGPKYGSYNPIDVVRPDGKVAFTVPGSIDDEGTKSLDIWLRRNGWKAW